MKPYLVNWKEDTRITLLLATLLHILLFTALFIALRHTKPLSLRAAATVAIIQATAVQSDQLLASFPKLQEKQAITPHIEQELIKPELANKSPITLATKEKLPTKVLHTTSPTTELPRKKSIAIKQAHAAPLNLPKKTSKENTKQHATQALHIAQKNIQQLLQQEVNTLIQKQQIAAHNAATTGKYRNLILQAIAQQWIIPPNVDKRLESKLLVQLAPGGMVLAVVVVKSSGNAVLDRSAETAVYKASPLPVPKGDLFNTFRQITLTVRPESMLGPS
jgi:colicin import membrane protein